METSSATYTDDAQTLVPGKLECKVRIEESELETGGFGSDRPVGVRQVIIASAMIDLDRRSIPNRVPDNKQRKLAIVRIIAELQKVHDSIG